MASGWRYRVASVVGTIVVTIIAVTVANLSIVQNTFAFVPYFGRPAPAILSSGELVMATSTTLVVALAATWPLFKPRPRRILDTILLAQRRVFLTMIALAALGYFNYSYRLPRSTLMVATIFMFVLLPAWMVMIRRRPDSPSRGVIVGDDPETMEAILEATDVPVHGYVSPPTPYAVGDDLRVEAVTMADGGTVDTRLDQLQCLGGLSRLDEVFVKHDIDTALLAFTETDRAEFFGTLDLCHEYGVTTMVHREHASNVLTNGVAGEDLVEVDLEPWDWQDYVVKRTFDVAFALTGLVLLAPFMLVIAVAIKLDSPGPVLYSQKRTAWFGDTFTVYKFRTMVPEGESPDPVEDDENDRITRVGRILRKTHLDELPQLWSILTGVMSVVGPRAAWTDEERLLERETTAWRKRWFVKPGLTGLAQVNGAKSTDPETKLRYDLEYIRWQSLWFDLKIVIRQVWLVISDIFRTIVAE